MTLDAGLCLLPEKAKSSMLEGCGGDPGHCGLDPAAQKARSSILEGQSQWAPRSELVFNNIFTYS